MNKEQPKKQQILKPFFLGKKLRIRGKFRDSDGKEVIFTNDDHKNRLVFS
jgi:hypothetical protein